MPTRREARTSVLPEGQNLGAGGIHFRRVCEVLTVCIKITTPKGVVIFMQITVKTDISAKSKNAAERRSQITTQGRVKIFSHFSLQALA